jgi:tellurite resistance protein
MTSPADGARIAARDNPGWRLTGLARIPIPTFGIGMGVLGLGLCWRYSGVLFHFSPLIGNIILLAGTVLWVCATAVQLVRLAVAPSAVCEELAHLIRGPLVAQKIIVILLLAEAAGPNFPKLAYGLLLAGTVLSVFVTLWVLTRFQAAQHDRILAPSWLVAPIALPFTSILYGADGDRIAASMSLGAGSLVITTLLPRVLAGISTVTAAPAQIRPLVVIAVAPLALIFIAYVQLAGVDGVAYGLLGATLFVVCLVLTTLPHWWRAPFGLPWWACGMPPAAVVLAIIDLAEKVRTTATLSAAAASLGIITAIMIILLSRTVTALINGRLFPPP